MQCPAADRCAAGFPARACLQRCIPCTHTLNLNPIVCAVQGGETLTTAIFGGSMCSTVRPAGGGGRAAARPSVTLEAFTMLQLYIGVPEVHSVEDALRSFVKAEELDSYKV